MIIELQCKNNHYIEIDEYLFRENLEKYVICPYCQEKMEAINTDMIVQEDIMNQIKNNVDKWFKEDGIEATIELIDRTRNTVGEKIYNLYKQEIRNRGLEIYRG